MTAEQETVLLIKGAISELLPEQRVRVDQVADYLRAMIKVEPLTYGLAVALIGAELAAQE